MELIYEIFAALRYLPLAIPQWAWVAFGILIFVSLIFLLFRRFFKKGPAKTQKPVPPALDSSPKEKGSDPKTEQRKRSSAYGSWLTSRVCKYRFIGFFRSFLKILRLHVSGRDYRYQIPWVLMIGEERSGKSTLLNYIQMDKPFGMPEPSESGCNAWLFERGIVLDLQGKYVLDSDAGSDAACWLQFIRTLRSFRPRKPLESIVLTVTAQELLSSVDQPDLARDKAELLYRKLWSIQRELGFRLPVYVLITQCDTLEGFGDFSQALPDRLRHNILGWSNSDILQAEYNNNYADQAFTQIYNDLNEIQLQLIAATEEIKNRDNFLGFPHKLRPVFKQLKPWLNKIFRPSVYQESFFLRGIYCCGGLAGEPASLEARNQNITSDELDFESGISGRSGVSRIIYISHLFRDKIFNETGIARPVTKSVLWQMRRLWSLQVIFFAVLLIFIGGQWWAYEQLNYEKSENILPVFDSIREDSKKLELARAQLQKSASNLAMLEKVKSSSAKHLISGLGEIRIEHYGSAFLPLSWFSPMDDDITQALATAYDKFILQWLYQGLETRIDDILFKNEVPLDRLSYADFKQVPEFIQLQNTMNQLITFEEHVNLYNDLDTLSTESNVDIIERIAYYANGLRVAPATQTHHNSLSGQALRKIQNFKPFRVEAYREKAQGQITYLANQWLIKFFSRNDLLLTINKITHDLDTIDDAGGNPEQLLANLETLQHQLKEIEEYLATPDWQWIAQKSVFDIPVFQELMAKASLVPLLGKPYAAQLMKNAELKFQQFKAKLTSLQSRLGGNVIEVNEGVPIGGVSAMPSSAGLLLGMGQPGAVAGQQAVKQKEDTAQNVSAKELATNIGKGDLSANKLLPEVPPSGSPLQSAQVDLLKGVVPGTRGPVLTLNRNQARVRQELVNFMQQDFMQSLPFGAIQENIPQDQFLLWDAQVLRKALKLVDSYFDYVVKNQANTLPELDETIRESGQTRLYNNLQSLLAKAQQFKSRSYALFFQEESLRENVENFAISAPLLSTLVNQLERLPENAGLITIIRQLIGEQGADLLARSGILLERENLYTPLGGVFSRWDGNSPLSQVAFGAADQEELEYYLKAQRERLIYLLEKYALPVVTHLLSQKGEALKASFLLPRWQRISQELDRYNRKEVGNAVENLEKFILFDLDKISLENCFSELKGAREHARISFFKRKMHALQVELFKQCTLLSEERGGSRYQVIQQQFSNSLAGYFPFAAIPDQFGQRGEMRSAHPDELRAFYVTFDQHQDDLDNMLEASNSFGVSRDQGIKFLDNIRNNRSFFQEFLESKALDALPEYEFTVDFRTNSGYEVGANQIIDWKLEVNSVPIKKIKGEWRGVWRYGDSVTLRLRWARNSRFRPYWDGKTHANSLGIVGEDTAVFNYHSDWALLEFLDSNTPELLDYPAGENRDNSLLKISVPVERLLETLPLSATEESAATADEVNDNVKQDTVVDNEKSLPQKEVLLYQDRYRELFQQPEMAIVYMRVKLFQIKSKKQAIFAPMPTQAPALSGLIGEMSEDEQYSNKAGKMLMENYTQTTGVVIPPQELDKSSADQESQLSSSSTTESKP